MTKRKDPGELKKRGRPPKTLQEKVDEALPTIKPHTPPVEPVEDDIIMGDEPEEQQEAPQSALATIDPTGSSVIAGMSTAQLAAGLQMQTEQRAIIKAFVKDHLEEGVDFGRIHVMSKDKCPNQYTCKLDYHFSKAVLFKPGQEKLFSLFQITGRLERDEETYKMLPDTKNLVAYKCVMYRGEKIIGEGRGSAIVNEKGRDVNATIKIAEKRARMDACLSLGFSEYFAQDLDDPDYKEQAEMANKQAAAKAESIDKDKFGLFPRDPAAPINDAERQMLYRLTVKAGFRGDEIVAMLKANGINDPGNMTSGQAREMMKLIDTNAFAPPAPAKADVVAEVPEGEITLDDVTEPAQSAPAIEETELVVDEDLKNYIVGKITNLALNGRGMMWLYTKVCGRPFAKWDKMSDAEWRKAYDITLAIEDGNFDIPDQYVKGFVESVPGKEPVDFSEPSKPHPTTELENVQTVFEDAQDMTEGEGGNEDQA